MGEGATTADLILAGGGLSAGLLALRLKRARPDLRIVIVERQAALGAGHTWSVFESDLEPETLAWVSPLFAHRWPGYAVRFPGHARRLAAPYASVTAERFAEAVTAAVGADNVLLQAEAAELAPDRLRLADGRVLTAPAVVDARGPDGPPPALKLGFQKFVGVEVECGAPHGLAEPVVMDATVPQSDGYRFLYVLPFSPTRLLVEDTRYADGDRLDRRDLAAEALAYAQAQGWGPERVVREEHGVLPVALAGDIHRFWQAQDADGVARIGLKAALFHPTTGYSLLDAARLAEAVAGRVEAGQALTTGLVRGEAVELSQALWADRGFYRLLNRMLFRAAAPDQRWRVLDRFYRLPAPLVRRFYAGRSTGLDKLRILSGRPPVPVGRAVACLSERDLLEAA